MLRFALCKEVLSFDWNQTRRGGQAEVTPTTFSKLMLRASCLRVGCAAGGFFASFDGDESDACPNNLTF
jgi:hypothetical protein